MGKTEKKLSKRPIRVKSVEEHSDLVAVNSILPKLKTDQEFNFVKRTCPMIKLSEMKEGFEFTAIYLKTKMRPITEQSSGEVKEVKEYVCCKIDDEEFTFSFLGDAGFNGSFHEADVQPNDVIKVVKKDQKNIKGGKRVNQYEIWVAE